MPEFSYSDLLPLGHDATSYQRLSSDGVTARSSFGRNFLEIEPQVLTLLTSAAMHDIAHLLRPAHLRQLRSILDDPEASPNDRYVARDLRKNACIAAGGVLNPARMASFLEEKIRSLGTAACPPYHLDIVVGGTSAEFALKTAKYASAKYLDTLPTSGSAAGHGFRDRELE